MAHWLRMSTCLVLMALRGWAADASPASAVSRSSIVQFLPDYSGRYLVLVTYAGVATLWQLPDETSAGAKRVDFLGPIVITYSQYGTVLGKACFPFVEGDRDKAPAPDEFDMIWTRLFDEVKVGMSRDEVEQRLGPAQAINSLDERWPTEGPATDVVEGYYGRKLRDPSGQPIVLPRESLLLTLGVIERNPGYYPRRAVRWEGANEDVVVNGKVVRPQDSWDVRYRRLREGTPRALCESVLGRPHTIWEKEYYCYGTLRISRIGAGQPDAKVIVSYDADDRLATKRYQAQVYENRPEACIRSEGNR